MGRTTSFNRGPDSPGGSPGPQPRATGIVGPDQVFSELDNLELFNGDQHWRVEVFSVSDQNNYRWVQVVVHGEPDRMLTLRLPAGARADCAIPALSERLAHPSVLSHLVDATASTVRH